MHHNPYEAPKGPQNTPSSDRPTSFLRSCMLPAAVVSLISCAVVFFATESVSPVPASGQEMLQMAVYFVLISISALSPYYCIARRPRDRLRNRRSRITAFFISISDIFVLVVSMYAAVSIARIIVPRLFGWGDFPGVELPLMRGVLMGVLLSGFLAIFHRFIARRSGKFFVVHCPLMILFWSGFMSYSGWIKEVTTPFFPLFVCVLVTSMAYAASLAWWVSGLRFEDNFATEDSPA